MSFFKQLDLGRGKRLPSSWKKVVITGRERCQCSKRSVTHSDVDSVGQIVYEPLKCKNDEILNKICLSQRIQVLLLIIYWQHNKYQVFPFHFYQLIFLKTLNLLKHS